MDEWCTNVYFIVFVLVLVRANDAVRSGVKIRRPVTGCEAAGARPVEREGLEQRRSEKPRLLFDVQTVSRQRHSEHRGPARAGLLSQLLS